MKRIAALAITLISISTVSQVVISQAKEVNQMTKDQVFLHKLDFLLLRSRNPYYKESDQAKKQSAVLFCTAMQIQIAKRGRKATVENLVSKEKLDQGKNQLMRLAYFDSVAVAATQKDSYCSQYAKYINH